MKISDELARRLESEWSSGNDHAVAVSADGGDWLYGELIIEQEPARDRFCAGTGGWSMSPGLKSWRVEVEVDARQAPTTSYAMRLTQLTLRRFFGVELSGHAGCYEVRAQCGDNHVTAVYLGSGPLEVVVA